MKSFSKLTAAEMRSVIALANELHDLGTSAHPPDLHLLNGLIEQTGGCSGFVGLLASAGQSEYEVPCARTSISPPGNLDGGEPHVLHSRIVKCENALLAHVLGELDLRPAAPYTIRRQQVIGDNSWYTSPHVRECRQPLGIDDMIISVSPVFDGLRSVLAIDREWGQTAFTDHHATLIHLVHSEIQWMFTGPLPRSPDARETRADSISICPSSDI